MKSRSNLIATIAGLSVLLLGVACGDGPAETADSGPDVADSGVDIPDSGTVPTVMSNRPLTGATDVPINGNASATFSEPMARNTLDATTFTVTAGEPPVEVLGTVVYTGSTAVFWPTAYLPSDTVFTATITTGAESASGIALAAAHSWTYTTGSTLGPGLPVRLGTAGDFAMLAKSAISTVPTSAVTGDVGVSPAAATFITGFSLVAHSTNVYATSTQVTGKVYAANYAVPTPANMTTAISDMETAFTDAAGRAPDVTGLASDIGGSVLDPGVYKWGTGLLISTDATLDGSATDVWIFQIAQGLTVGNGVTVHLTGGAVPENVFWQVAGAVELGTTSHLEGVVLTQTSITLDTGASIDGRLLAQTAITIRGATVVEPAN